MVGHVGEQYADRHWPGGHQIDERGANARENGNVDGIVGIHEADNHGQGVEELANGNRRAKSIRRPAEPRLESDMVVMSSEVATRRGGSEIG